MHCLWETVLLNRKQVCCKKLFNCHSKRQLLLAAWPHAAWK